MRRVSFIIIGLWAYTLSIWCTSNETEKDNSQFVTASLIVASPGDAIYSSFGHCAIRMECPEHGLDYCFSLEMDAQPGDYLKFFTGKSMARVIAVPSEDFILSYKEEGRGVSQHPLNLTLPEKQLLWKNLDEEMVKPPHLTFNLLKTNCAMMSIIMIENALIGEQVVFKKMPKEMALNNGELLRYCSNHTPWGQFIYMIFYGAVSDEQFETEYRLSPNMIIDVLKGAVISSNETTEERPLFKGETKQILPQTTQLAPHSITPTLLFSFILILILIITFGEWCFGWNRIAHITDAILLVSQTGAGIIILYASVFANLFGNRWNWYLIPFNPLPMLIWLLAHKKTHFWKIYLFYSITLIIFISITPLSSQLDIPHQIITIILLVRTLNCYLIGRKQNK